MLSKSEPKKIYQFKYLLLALLVLGMLVYTSCNTELDSNKEIIKISKGDYQEYVQLKKYDELKLYKEQKLDTLDKMIDVYENMKRKRGQSLSDSETYKYLNLITPFIGLQEPPIFPGCENEKLFKENCFKEKMSIHIDKHFNYPKKAKEQAIEGEVIVAFIISKDGTIKDIRKRGANELLENEAVRIIELLP